MNILYTLNDNFAPQVAAGIVSVCENNKDVCDIHFYLFSFGVSKNNKERISNIVNRYHRNIEIIELNALDSYFDFDFDTNGWNNIVLSRLLMGEILPKEVDRIIYLDGDTIVRNNLKELWETNLSNKILGMSIEPTVNREQKESLGLKDYPYYNSGVMLVDLDAWRKTDVFRRVTEFAKERDGKLFAPDQDAINGTLKDEILTISPKYNFYNIFYQYPYRFMCKLMKDVPYISKDMYNDAVKNPTIIHYLGEERPWRKGNHHRYLDDFNKYLTLAEYQNECEEKGWELYYVCWYIFNFFTKPFPELRYQIITSLIPSFMKIRAKKVKKDKNK